MNSPTYELDGDVVNLEELIKVNEFDQDTVDEIYALLPGYSMYFGGGAFATFVLKRLS